MFLQVDNNIGTELKKRELFKKMFRLNVSLSVYVI